MWKDFKKKLTRAPESLSRATNGSKKVSCMSSLLLLITGYKPEQLRQEHTIGSAKIVSGTIESPIVLISLRRRVL